MAIKKKPVKKAAAPVRSKPVAAKPVAKKPAPRPVAEKKTGKGILHFWYSFTGSISKELYTGAVAILTASSLTLGIALTLALNFMPATTSVATVNAMLYTFGVLQVLIVLSMVAIAYKRAHALGISGFYSIVGSSIFSPYFKYFKSSVDAPKDGDYRCSFSRLKRLGGFITKNAASMITYLVLVALVTVLLGMDAGRATLDSASRILVWLAAFNIIQVLSVDFKLVQRFYTPVVKVLSLAAYTIVVIEITRIYTAYQFFQALITSVQAGAI